MYTKRTKCATSTSGLLAIHYYIHHTIKYIYIGRELLSIESVVAMILGDIIHLSNYIALVT